MWAIPPRSYTPLRGDPRDPLLSDGRSDFSAEYSGCLVGRKRRPIATSGSIWNDATQDEERAVTATVLTEWERESHGTLPWIDLVVLAKAISGGYLPLGAVLVHDRVAAALMAAGLDDLVAPPPDPPTAR